MASGAPTGHPNGQHEKIPTSAGSMAITMGQAPPLLELACGRATSMTLSLGSGVADPYASRNPGN